uniref:late histone H2B.L4-like n=1 Tax=Odobenus rosmarus divergens TaxID=9708 RepID=UPI00063C6886|nr:PREDICTED: late histone H2B.L4-like [Odobenus rosmarus divergens]
MSHFKHFPKWPIPSASAPRSPRQETQRARSRSSRGAVRRHGCRRRRRYPDSFATYFPSVLRHVHEALSLSQEAVSVMDSFAKDMFEHIAEEASLLARSNKRSTITTRDIQTAAHVLLEIGKHAVSEATKAVIMFKRLE